MRVCVYHCMGREKEEGVKIVFKDPDNKGGAK